MTTIRKSADRGWTRTPWLESRHSFSFAAYHDPQWMGFRALRVINEDRVAPASGFGPHPHRDMEILTVVLGGTLEHRDSGGNRSRLGRGSLQRISAGTGIVHSEVNPSREEPTHFLQIWLLPEARGLEPCYEERHFDPEPEPGRLRLLASRDGEEGSLRVHQDLRLLAGRVAAGQLLEHELAADRHAWLQVVRGRLEIDGRVAEVGDGVATAGGRRLVARAAQDSELLVFDLA